ncbi:MAG TPA: C4-dicarboxylate transporter DctA [Steroidobacteraceae bacterium]|nr:C4-dicarboxylate transporter DctA [Steroidobacteraceae bacterium]
MQALIPKAKPFYAKLHNQVIIAIAAAIIMGAVWPDTAVKMKPLGDGFIKLIGMMIAPIVFCIIVSGISGMGSARQVGRISVKSMVYFYVVSALALLLGMIAANLIPTGTGLNIDPRSIDTSSIAGYVTAAKDQGVVTFLLNIIPVTMMDAFAKGAILQVVLIAALFGVALIFLGDRARAVKELVDQLTKVVFSIVEMIIKLSPVGAFGAMAFTVGRFGLHALLPLLKLILVFYGACFAFVLIVLVPIARRVGFSVLKFCRYILDEILIFLSIANSEALLPRLMEKLERMGVPKSVVGLVVPTGYSFNLAGSSIYFTLCIIFIAQATNTALPLDRQLVILLVALLMSKGATGFTGAGFVVLAGTLSAIPDIPMAGLALLLGIDPFMQRGRGLVNYIGNGIAAIAIAAWEKDLDVAELNRRLSLGPDGDTSTAPNAPIPTPRDESLTTQPTRPSLVRKAPPL